MTAWAIALFVLAGIVARLVAPHAFSAALGPLVLVIFLPALLFDAAWDLQWQLLRKHWKPIVMLAVPGVCVTAAIVAAACWVAGIPIALGLLLGAVLSATDPVAIVALFRRLAVSRALFTIVEGEALFNDGVAVVLYRAVLAAIALGAGAGQELTIAAQAIGGTCIGIAIGVITALLAGRMLTRTTSAGLRIIATLFCAYATYFIADMLHASGIFATIAAGITLAHSEQGEPSFSVDEQVDRFWTACAFIANAALFFLIGATLDPQAALRQPYVALVTLIGIAVARIILAYGLLPLSLPGLTRGWKLVVAGAMVRGALCLALVVDLPSALPYRGILIDVTFTVVAVTLAAMFLLLPAIVRRESVS